MRREGERPWPRRRRAGRTIRRASATAVALLTVALALVPTAFAQQGEGSLDPGAHAGRHLLSDERLDSEGAAADNSQQPSSQNHTELQQWRRHYKHRRLQQTIGVGVGVGVSGSIAAQTPSATLLATLLRRADRNQPAGNGPGGTGAVQLLRLSDAEAISVAETLLADSPASDLGLGILSFSSVENDTLAYKDGYAMFRSEPYKTFRYITTKEDCGALCDDEPDCVAWSRMAGGDASVRSCSLLNSTALRPLAPASPGPSQPGVTSFQAKELAPSADAAEDAAASALTYTPPNSPLIVESGTRTGFALPEAAYGCPYPPIETGECVPPPGCNCFRGLCFGSCQSGERMSLLASLNN